MSTSLLHHAFGLRGHRYRRTCYEDGHVSFKVELKAEQLCCSACQCRSVVRRGRVERRFRSHPIGNKPVWRKWAGVKSCFMINSDRQT